MGFEKYLGSRGTYSYMGFLHINTLCSASFVVTVLLYCGQYLGSVWSGLKLKTHLFI